MKFGTNKMLLEATPRFYFYLPSSSSFSFFLTPFSGVGISFLLMDPLDFYLPTENNSNFMTAKF
jgi:hypothetical protein